MTSPKPVSVLLGFWVCRVVPKQLQRSRQGSRFEGRGFKVVRQIGDRRFIDRRSFDMTALQEYIVALSITWCFTLWHRHDALKLVHRRTAFFCTWTCSALEYLATHIHCLSRYCTVCHRQWPQTHSMLIGPCGPTQWQLRAVAYRGPEDPC